MRDALTGQNGEAGFAGSGGSDMDRLMKLKKAVDSIERRIAAQSARPPYAAPTMPAGDVANMQQQLNMISQQIAQSQQYPPAYAAPPMVPPAPVYGNHDSGAAAHMIKKTTDKQQKTLEQIAKQLASLKSEFDDLKQTGVVATSGLTDDDLARVTQQLSKVRGSANFDEAAFSNLTTELAQIRNSMKEQMGQTTTTSKSISGQIDQLSNSLSDMASGVSEMTNNVAGLSVQAANAIAPKVDGLSKQLHGMRVAIDDLPQSLSISRLDKTLADLAGKLDTLPADGSNAPDLSKDFGSIESRLDEVARALVAVSNMGRNAPEPDLSALDRLEARLSDMGRVIDDISSQHQTLQKAVEPQALAEDQLSSLSRRIEGLTDRLASFEKYAASGDLGGATAMFAGPETGVIEEQLAQLTSRLDAAISDNASNIQLSNLEAQVGKILRQLDKNAPKPVDFAPVESRLGQIESALATNQKHSLETAQRAAQEAIALLGPQTDSGQAVAALSKQLETLQKVAQNGSAANQSSIEKINQALTEVVSRLGTIETSLNAAEVAPVAASQPRMPKAPQLDPQPSIAATADATVQAAQQVMQAARMETAPVAQPIPAAPAAPNATYTISTGGFHDAPIDTRTVQAPSIDPIADVNAQPPVVPANQAPLEPAAEPDLGQMVAAASAQLNAEKASLSSGADNIRTDPVGAARRAIQATTEEMNAGEVGVVAEEEKSSSAIAALLSRFKGDGARKPLIIATAATLIFVLAAFSYKKFLNNGETNTPSLAQAPAIEKSIENEPQASIEQKITSEDKTLIAPEKAPESAVEPRIVDPEPEAKVTIPADPQQAAPQTVEQPKPATVEVTPTAPAVTAVEPNTTGENTEALSTEVAVVPTNEAVEQPAAVTFDVPSGIGVAALVDAAKKGDPKALFEVGMRYSDGKSVKRNMVESAKWFERSAETGFAPAQYSIGSLYEKGIGVDRDIAIAAEWYQKAAVQGNARAMHNLAVISATGNNGPADMETAVEWFKQAAKLGIKDSQFNLGILYGQGMGVPQNLAESYKWFALAAKTGDTDAAGKRDEVGNAMDPADLDAARKQVSEWTPGTPDEAANKVSIPQEWRAASNPTGKELIQSAQAKLNERGFDVGTPDGLMGPKTKRAVMEFQRSAGLPVTGKVDKKLITALGG